MIRLRHIVLLSLVLCLPACLTIDEDISLRQDGTALVTISYNIPASVYKNPKAADELRKSFSFPIPLTEEELKSYYQGIPGVTIRSFVAVPDKASMRVNMALECRSLDLLTKGPILYRVADLGGAKVFTVAIALPPPPGASDSSPQGKPPAPAGSPARLIQEAMAASQKALAIKISATFPTRVLWSNGQASGRTVTWTTPLFRMGGRTSAVFEARFRSTPSLWDRIRNIITPPR